MPKTKTPRALIGVRQAKARQCPLDLKCRFATLKHVEGLLPSSTVTT
ncbi:MAG: hypothetical protein [Arizlama microvirus]|nr:MAG: hypothetical protein [Arizlama microvirus]